jgi:putative exosortase-associated protein (TIGR04073 family)
MSFTKRIIVVGIVLFAVAFASDTFAASGPLEKLGRGIANIAFGPLEILIRPYDVNQEKGAIAAWTYGVLKGVAYVVARECVGVTDVVTFPMPLPGATDDPEDSGWGYGPLMRPPWVVDMEHNAFNFFYGDEAITR